MNIQKSINLYNKAIDLIPGGVNSPVRACKSVESDPVFIDNGKGAVIEDSDGNKYIDYVGSWGPLILGHSHPKVISAIQNILIKGLSFGAPTELEIELAKLITEAFPSIEMIRMVNSGTEATMSAIRLARGYTQRDTIIKFDGCYHGHADTLLVQAGSGVATLSIAGSPGVPNSFVKHTISLPYNDFEKLKLIMDTKGSEIACIIVEPVAGNMGLVKPEKDFLKALRDYTKEYDALLIFDEVMTGFRVAYGGAQAIYNIDPDLTCLGKIIGGGMPVGAYGGKKNIMNKIAPIGPVYQAGTLSGNPVAMAAGIATLKELKQPGFYENLDKKSDQLIDGLNEIKKDIAIPFNVDKIGSMMGLFFNDKRVKNFDDAKKCDLKNFNSYYKGMRENGIYLAPSQFEAFFMSAAHTEQMINDTIDAAKKVLKSI